MITLYYIHRCSCSFQGQEVVIRPEMKGTVWIQQEPMCTEELVALYLDRIEVE